MSRRSILQCFRSRLAVLTIGCVAVVLAVVPVDVASAGKKPSSAPSHTLTDLGSGFAFAVNNLGHVVGQLDGRAVLWESGNTVFLGEFGTPSRASDINDNDVAVGFLLTPEGKRAAVWRNGIQNEIGTLGGHESDAVAINNLGQVAGNSNTDDPTGDEWRSFVWEDGQFFVLPILDGQDTTAFDINDRGDVVGRADRVGISATAVLWENGIPIDLGADWQTSAALAINENGDVVGHANISDDDTFPLIWENGTPRLLSNLDGTRRSRVSGLPIGVNAAQQAVGLISSVDDRNATKPLPQASITHVLWENGIATDLQNTMPSGWTIERVTDINDSGQICGFGTFNGEQRSFLLTPQ